MRKQRRGQNNRCAAPVQVKERALGGGRNAKSANPFVSAAAEARRIVGELVKLHKAGAIKNELRAALAGTHVLWWSRCWQGGALPLYEVPLPLPFGSMSPVPT